MDVEISKGVILRGEKTHSQIAKEKAAHFKRLKETGELDQLTILLNFLVAPDECFTHLQQHATMEYLSTNPNFLQSIDVLIDKIKKNNPSDVKRIEQKQKRRNDVDISMISSLGSEIITASESTREELVRLVKNEGKGSDHREETNQ